MEYNFKEIEIKQQKIWENENRFKTKIDSKENNFYVLEMFMYPSGDMHIGHLRNYTLGDVVARYKKMKGFNVLHPVGWDSFGLPAEMAAISRGVSPKKWTNDNIREMKNQLKKIGISYDWSREISTCSEKYYKWNQWIFSEMYKKGIAYKNKALVNWDVDNKTVLANEQVKNGISWRGGRVVKKELNQWFLKITDYAEQLLEGHKELENNWPEKVITMQRNWIGKSYGVEIDFILNNRIITVFTTRLDTIYGVSYIALAKNHFLSLELINLNEEIKNFCERENISEESKEGIFTNIYVKNPINQQDIPVWIADYVLDYGSLAVMGVPSHDERDYKFALKNNLKLLKVIFNETNDEDLYLGKGILINSDIFNNLNSEDAKIKIYNFFKKENFIREKVNYKLRDWLISRQRFWGTPIPVLYNNNEINLETNIPVLLPEDVDFKVEGNPLEKLDKFKNTIKGIRETDTMDTFFDSSWYYLRYLDNLNENEIFSKKLALNWPQVDVYIGGVEHAVMHLLYSRFMHKFLRDLNLVSSNEPFKKYIPQGLVLAKSYYDKEKNIYYTEKEFKNLNNEKDIIINLEKMSKSKKNGISVNYAIDKYGADATRIFILFTAPLDRDLEWNESGIEGSLRFLKRVWKLVLDNKDLINFNANFSSEDDKQILRELNKCIKKVSEHMENLTSFNVALALLMELVNKLYLYKVKSNNVLGYCLKNLILMLSPFAPHLSEELWKMMNLNCIEKENWPKFNENYIKDDILKIPVQVNGKLKTVLECNSEDTDDHIISLAKSNIKVSKYLQGNEKIIYIANKLLNFVNN